MRKSLNTPYTRKSGFELSATNPFVTQGDNRRERRRTEPPFIGNGKQHPLTVSGTVKYLRKIQIVPIKMKNGKVLGGNKILHYLSA